MDDEERDELLRELVRQNAVLVARFEASQRGAASTGKTLRQLYELDEAAWGSTSWAPQRRGTLAAGLRHFGERIADSITRAEWQRWRDHVRGLEVTNRKAVPTPWTLNFEIGMWRSIYRRQHEDGNCVTNPLMGLRKVRGAKKNRETEPTRTDLEQVRPHCTDRTWAFVLLAFRRGLRASEARCLEWRQIDLTRGRIQLHAWQEKTRRNHNLRITTDVIEALRAIRPEVGRFVFPGRGGHAPIVASTLWRNVRDAFDAAGLEAAPGDGKVTYHDLRHGYTSTAARKLPIQQAMGMSRHRSLSAAQRYIHLNERDHDAGHEAMEQEDTRKPPHSADSESAQEGQTPGGRINSADSSTKSRT